MLSYTRQVVPGTSWISDAFCRHLVVYLIAAIIFLTISSFLGVRLGHLLSCRRRQPFQRYICFVLELIIIPILVFHRYNLRGLTQSVCTLRSKALYLERTFFPMYSLQIAWRQKKTFYLRHKRSPRLGNNDLLIIYFSGHGAASPQDAYLLPTDVALDNSNNRALSTAISITSDLAPLVGTNKKLLLLADTTHFGSGALGNPALKYPDYLYYFCGRDRRDVDWGKRIWWQPLCKCNSRNTS